MKVPFSDLAAMHEEVRELVEKAWSDRMERGDFVRGGPVAQFEQEWAAYCGADRAIGVGNGTDALQLTLRALDIGPGDEVILPANTFIATAEAVLLVGAIPRFADVDPDTLLVSAETVRPIVSARTKALIVVHLFGQVADMDALTSLCDEIGIALIEDAAQAHGATWRGRRAGSFGRAACFSFYPGKNLGAFGDGGAVVTSDAWLADRIDAMRDHGRPNGAHLTHLGIGTNSRLDTLQAAILSAKLTRLDDWTDRRRQAADWYRRYLGPGARLVEESPLAESVHHLLVVQVPERDHIRSALASVGIATGIHYPMPCHQADAYRRYSWTSLPVVEQAAGRILSLPMFPHISEQQVRAVCEALDSALAGVVADVA